MLQGSVLGLISCGGGGGGGGGVAEPSSVGTCGSALVGTLPTSTNLAKAVRTAPHANFSWFTRDFTIVSCSGPNGAAVQEDLSDVFMRKYRAQMVGGIAYVDVANGSDGNSGCSWSTAYKTIDMALRTSHNCVVYVAPGYYTSWTGFRFTDTEGTRPKALIAPQGAVTIAYPGDALSAAIWHPTSSAPNTYQTRLLTTNVVTRVLDANFMDELGLPKPIPKQASVVTVDNSSYGWWYDKDSSTLYVRTGTLDVNQIKARLTAIYATDNDNQFRITGSILYVEGFTLIGYPSVYNALDQKIPEVWLKNVTVRYAEGHSRAVFGGKCYSQGGTYYRSTADHANYNVMNGVTSHGVEINDATWYAGDIDTFGSGLDQPNNAISPSLDKNGSSNHDSYVVRINGMHNASYGSPIADTGPSYSWCMGTQTGYSYATNSSGQRYGFLMHGNNAWLDSCQAGSALDATIESASGADVHVSNCFGLQVASNGGKLTPYAPS